MQELVLGGAAAFAYSKCHKRIHTRAAAELAIKFMARPIPKVVLPMIFHEVKIQAALGEGHVNLVQVCLGSAGFACSSTLLCFILTISSCLPS